MSGRIDKVSLWWPCRVQINASFLVNLLFVALKVTVAGTRTFLRVLTLISVYPER